MSKTLGRCESMVLEVNNNTRQKVREWDSSTIAKGSRQQLQEMTIYTGNGNDIIQGVTRSLR